MLLTSRKRHYVIGEKFSDTNALFEALLNVQGIDSEEMRRSFLTDEGGSLYDPFLYKDMHKAVDIIVDAMTNNDKILIYGDYDCDGVTATSILVRYFRSHNIDVVYIVPNREEHGYGLTSNILDEVVAHNPDLVITVDCGITNIDTVKELKDRGIKVIVTDHHNVQENLPEALAVICSKRTDNTYPFKDLCGAGVALKVIQALGTDRRFPVNGTIWRQTIELAGIATIADLVGVTDENRTIIKKAFISMKNPVNPGIKVMIDLLLENSSAKKLDESFISFNFVPRINAAGRLYDSSDALKLFLEDDEEKAMEAAVALGRQNDERKEIEAKVFDEARAQLENPARPDRWSLTNTCGPIVVYGKDWHQGVLGIVAGKLSQYYGRSALVFTDDATEPGCAKGSGRAFGDFDLYECLERISDKLVNFGGHKKAAGLLVRKSEMGLFMETLENDAAKIIREKGQSGEESDDDKLEVECEIMPGGLNFDSYHEVSKLRPFGIGNPKPVFVTHDLIVANIAQMSAGAHIRMDLTDAEGSVSLSAVGFGMGDYFNVIRAGDKIDIAYTINEYCYRGETSLSLHLEDIRLKADGGFMWQKADIAEKLYTSGLAMSQIAKMAPGEDIVGSMKPTPEIYGACYKAIERFGGTSMSTVDNCFLARLVSNNYDVAVTPFQVMRCLEVFADCRLIRLRMINPTRACFNIITAGDKVKLSDSEVYRRIQGE